MDSVRFWPVRPRSFLTFGLLRTDRKSTRLNSSHSQISYAVFCLKKKNKRVLVARNVARLNCKDSQTKYTVSSITQNTDPIVGADRLLREIIGTEIHHDLDSGLYRVD